MSHFYDSKDGRPVYEVPMSTKEGMRATTVKDARKLALVPSVTTVTGVLDKSGLLYYFYDKIVKAVFEEPELGDHEDWDVYVDRLIKASKKESEKASKRGSYLHDLLEKYIKGDVFSLSNEDFGYIEPVLHELDLLKPLKDGSGEITSYWNAEKSFSNSVGYGGKVDLYWSDGKNHIIIDFKTKNTTEKKKFYRYDEHLMQLAAYRYGLGMPDARCIDIYFSALEPGIIEVHEWSEEDLIRGFEMFRNLLGYWQLKNNYDSSYNTL